MVLRAANRLVVAWLLATPAHVCGFGSLQYLNRPTTDVTTYTSTADPHMPLPFTFNNGELEVNVDQDGEVIVKQNVVPPPPAPRPPSPLAPPPPTPFEHFSGGACTHACHKLGGEGRGGRGRVAGRVSPVRDHGTALPAPLPA